jgi:hypothetical protein
VTPKTLLHPLLLSLALLVVAGVAASAEAQGPPGGSPGSLPAEVEALTQRVEDLEALTALLRKRDANHTARITALELEAQRPGSRVPTGTVMPFAGPAAQVPAGWLLCDGAELDRAVHARLFAVIGTAHGHGDAATTFQIPDYRGMFLRGVDLGRTVDPDRFARGNFPGGNVDDAVGSYQQDTFRHHGHGLGALGICDAGDPNGGLFAVFNVFSHCKRRFASTPVGGNETRPHNIYVNYVIKD